MAETKLRRDDHEKRNAHATQIFCSLLAAEPLPEKGFDEAVKAKVERSLRIADLFLAEIMKDSAPKPTRTKIGQADIDRKFGSRPRIR